MEDHLSQQRHTLLPLLKHLAVLFLFFLTGLFLSQTLLQGIFTLAGGESLSDILTEVKSGQAENAHWVLLLQVFNQISGFALSVFLTALFFHGTPKLISWRIPSLLPMLIIIPVIISIYPLLPFLSLNMESFHLPSGWQALESYLKQAQTDTDCMIQTLLGSTAGRNPIVRVWVFALVPAVCEEIFFRGALLKFLSSALGAHAGIWICGFVFSLIHFQISGFMPRFLLGVMFGYFVLWSGSIFPAIWGHFLFNAGSLLLLFQQDSFQTVDMGVFTLTIVFISPALLIFSLFYLKKFFYKTRLTLQTDS